HTIERNDGPVLDRVTPVGIEVGEVSTGEDADHARQRLGLARVDGQHLCVGERGAQHLSVHHPRHDDVPDELGRAAELLLRVTPRYRPADVRELRALDDRHALTSASSATASTIAWYPVQRQRLPARPRRIPSRESARPSSSRNFAVSSIPPVQKPHWRAAWSAKARSKRSNSDSSANPSTVSTCRPSTSATSVQHELTGRPSTSTVQVPQTCTSHERFAPVSPCRS